MLDTVIDPGRMFYFVYDGDLPVDECLMWSAHESAYARITGLCLVIARDEHAITLLNNNNVFIVSISECINDYFFVSRYINDCKVTMKLL